MFVSFRAEKLTMKLICGEKFNRTEWLAASSQIHELHSNLMHYCSFLQWTSTDWKIL